MLNKNDSLKSFLFGLEFNKIKGFTLIELIIVITILAILTTLSFISFSSYQSQARDTDRVTTIKNLENGLEIFHVNSGKYPMPEGEVSQGYINNVNNVYSYKGIIDDYLSRIIKINKTAIDPLSKNKYIYAVSGDKSTYQIATTLENGVSFTNNYSNNIIPITYADSNSYQAKVVGNYPGYVKFSSGSDVYIANIPSLIWTNSGTSINLLSTGTYYVVNKQQNLPYLIKDNINQDISADQLLQKIYGYTGVVLTSINISPIINSDNKKTAIEQVFGTGNTESSKSKIASFGGLITNSSSSSFDFQKIEMITTGNISSGGAKLVIYLNCNESTQSGYLFTPLSHGASLTKTKDISNGNTSLTASCNDGNLAYQSEVVNCNNGFVEGPNFTCVTDNCNGTITDPNAHSTATSQSQSTSWHYSATQGICTYDCNVGFHYDTGTSACVSNTKTFTCANKPITGTIWNSVSSYTQTWNGTTYSPPDSSTSYNLTNSTTTCNYTCDTTNGYIRNSGTSTCESKLYVDDVFSTYLYTGNGSTQTINNGIDLAGQGGLVWIKYRGTGQHHSLIDTARGSTKRIYTDLTNAQDSNGAFTNFNSNGFSLGNQYSGADENYNTYNYASWTFRKAPKFFDVVTYTGDGVAGRQIAHNLGVIPGMIVIKKISGSSDWKVWHRTLSDSARQVELNSASSAFVGTSWFGTLSQQTTTYFTLGDLGTAGDHVNSISQNYVAYVFAHDPSPEGIIQAGSFTTDASGNANIDLGWEPQWVLTKHSSVIGPWLLSDSMRGMPVDSQGFSLTPNLSRDENQTDVAKPFSTGFKIYNTPSQTYIYLAIRKPNKPATSGNQVFSAITRTGNGTATSMTGVGFAPDLFLSHKRTEILGGGGGYATFWDKLRGVNIMLSPQSTNSEGASANGWTIGTYLSSFNMDGITLGADTNALLINKSVGSTFINWFFKRTSGVFDELAYTGNGVGNSSGKHGLGVEPEMIIFKNRTSSADWGVYHKTLGASAYLLLNSSASVVNSTYQLTNSTPPTTTNFSVWNNIMNNASGNNYIAYLFASKPGISKVGSYTGNGSNQTIDANLNSTARFILIKRTDSAGDWYVWDYSRGIVINGSEPHMKLNSTEAEGTADSVDPYTSGFIVKQNTTTNINVSGANYIYFTIN